MQLTTGPAVHRERLGSSRVDQSSWWPTSLSVTLITLEVTVDGELLERFGTPERSAAAVHWHDIKSV
jgi:hypothetical protein